MPSANNDVRMYGKVPDPFRAPRVLVVEDDVVLADGLRHNLEVEGYEVVTESDGRRAFSLLNAVRPDVVILDLMLPGLDGLELLRRWRETGDTTRIVILTARAEEGERARGLNMGADDYIVKPFSVLELIARVAAQIRRIPSGSMRVGTIQIGDTCFDRDTRAITHGAESVPLTPREFELLSALVAADGAVLSRETILCKVWRYPVAIDTNTIDQHIASLRRKIRDTSRPRSHIITVKGVGYRLRLHS